MKKYNRGRPPKLIIIIKLHEMYRTVSAISRWRYITTDALTRAKNLGLVTAVWTVNALEEIDRMIEYGVDAIITDYPGRVQQRLAGYGYNW